MIEFWEHAERHFFFPELSILFCNLQVCWWILKHRPGAGIIGVSSAGLHYWIGMCQSALTVYCVKSHFLQKFHLTVDKSIFFPFYKPMSVQDSLCSRIEFICPWPDIENNLLLNLFAVKLISDSPLHELSYFETSEIWMWKLWRRILPSCWWVGMRAVPNFGYLLHSFTYYICSEREIS